MKFADWIKNGMYDKKLVREQLGISPSAMYSILTGIYLPGLETALAIEKLTMGKVRCEDWLTEKPKDEKHKRGKVDEHHKTDEPKFNVI